MSISIRIGLSSFHVHGSLTFPAVLFSDSFGFGGVVSLMHRGKPPNLFVNLKSVLREPLLVVECVIKRSAFSRCTSHAMCLDKKNVSPFFVLSGNS